MISGTIWKTHGEKKKSGLIILIGDRQIHSLTLRRIPLLMNAGTACERRRNKSVSPKNRLRFWGAK